MPQGEIQYTRKMAPPPPHLLLLATACVFVAVGNARAPRPRLATGPDLAATSAAAADDAHAPPSGPSPALATAPLATTGTEGLVWTPAYANGTAAGGEAAVLGRHRRGACAHTGHCCTLRAALISGAGPVQWSGGMCGGRARVAWGLGRMTAAPRRGLELFAAHHLPHPRARGRVRVRGGGVQTTPRSLAPTLSLFAFLPFAACPLSVVKPPRKGGAAAAAHG